MKSCTRALILLCSVLSSLVLVACAGAGASVKGQSYKAPIDKISSMGVLLQNNSFKEGDYPTVSFANGYSRMLFPIIHHRIKYVFQANGVAVSGLRSTLDSPTSSSLLDFECCEYVLRLRQERFTTGSQGTHLVLGADLMSKHAGLIWNGSITTSGFMGRGYYDKLADEVLRKLLTQLQNDGIIAGQAVILPPASSIPVPAVGDIGSVPGLDANGLRAYMAFIKKVAPRAFAVAPYGGWGTAAASDEKDPFEPEDSAQRALARCQKASRTKCSLYALDDKVVWHGK